MNHVARRANPQTAASVKFRLPIRREARSGASAVKGKQNVQVQRHDSPCDSQGVFFTICGAVF